MTDVGAFDPEDHVFRDIGGVIGDALQGAADHERIQSLRSEVAFLAHYLGQADVGCTVHVVDGIVHAEDVPGHLGVGFDERLKRPADHIGGQGGHARDVDGEIGDLHRAHGADTIADTLGGVAYSLQVGVDLDDGENEAEIDGHGLLHGEQVEGGLVDISFEAIDGHFAAADEIADGEVANTIGLDGALDGLFGEAGHDQKLFFEIVEAALKANPCHPNLPVM